MSEQTVLPPKEVLEHVVDVHCHPTDAGDISDDVMNNLHIKICAMATHSNDQQRVSDLATRFPDNVIPCFGPVKIFHPWWYHEISLFNPPPPKEDHYRSLFLPKDAAPKKQEEFEALLPVLPEPRSLDEVLELVRSKLLAHPTAMLGEVGLDRSFRIGYQPYPSPPPRKLSPFITPIQHQLAILEAQFALAVELKRNISMHSVASQQITLDLMARMKEKHGAAWRAISIDMHSCGLSLESWKSLEANYTNVFLSLSTVINSRSDNHILLIRNCAEDRLLAESDYNSAEKCTSQTWTILETIAQIRGWPLETSWEDGELPEEEWGVVRRLERNWKRFAEGNHPELQPRKSRRLRKQHEHYPSDESEAE
ncbi:hypothetical protein M408DRAFT_63027 [Serendipita vermifera MAFF 305830]|uniref:TatD DNase family Scn1 n=1 Tax=Serendipita vermifera MAFF 305830 TaxID=933852 RepID=A0A0C3B624_SERVB|nr:hypothetical protein M408DRAFT_63027 [Serendipita vermifera MAFF 305830]